MRQAGAKAKSSTPSPESKNSAVIESPSRADAKRRVFGTGGIFEKNRSRFLYISYRDRNGKLRQESTKSESLMVAERLPRDRLGKVEQGLPVAEMKKLKYEDIRKTLIMDYRARGVKMLEEDKGGNPYVWGFEYLDPFFKNRLVRTSPPTCSISLLRSARKKGRRTRR